MNNEQFPAPEAGSAVEAHGDMQANPLEGNGVPGVEVNKVTEGPSGLIEVPAHMKAGLDALPAVEQPKNVVRAGEKVPIDDSDRRVPIDDSDRRVVLSRPGDPGHEEKVAAFVQKQNHNQAQMHAAANNAELKGQQKQ